MHHTKFLLTSNYFVLQILSGGTTPFANSLSTPKCGIGSELGCLRTTSPSITTQRMLEDRYDAFTCCDLSVSSIILLYIAKSSLLRVICHFVFLFRSRLLQRIMSLVSQLVRPHHILFEQCHTKPILCSSESKLYIMTETVRSLP